MTSETQDLTIWGALKMAAGFLGWHPSDMQHRRNKHRGWTNRATGSGRFSGRRSYRKWRYVKQRMQARSRWLNRAA